MNVFFTDRDLGKAFPAMLRAAAIDVEEAAVHFPSIVRAISIREPYVELILRGVKRHEYRSRPTHVCERVYLYASNTAADDARAWRAARAQPGELPTGVVVGSVEISGCKWDKANECYAYSLRRPRRLARPRKARNQPQPVFWIPKFR